ncbi:MAG TPA: hypothetical protein VGO40_13380 [Longimicrobium sp.]|jgi:hypothetical protein|nr:hypothetical protein [Longimicrobium sp.]
MTRATRSTLAALAVLALAAAPAGAQTGNQSDITGPVITGSGPAGGSFLGAGLRSENELFGRAADAVVFRNARIGCAVRGAEAAYRDSVAREPQTPAQRRVLDLLAVNADRPAADPVAAAVAAALAHGADPGSPLGMAARRLADALDGLMRDRGGCAQARQEYTEAPQWREAIDAFQHYVHDAPDSAFSPPAPELLAIHAALQRVVEEALRRRGR